MRNSSIGLLVRSPNGSSGAPSKALRGAKDQIRQSHRAITGFAILLRKFVARTKRNGQLTAADRLSQWSREIR
jgi:hypothetical protein